MSRLRTIVVYVATLALILAAAFNSGVQWICLVVGIPLLFNVSCVALVIGITRAAHQGEQRHLWGYVGALIFALIPTAFIDWVVLRFVFGHPYVS